MKLVSEPALETSFEKKNPLQTSHSNIPIQNFDSPQSEIAEIWPLCHWISESNTQIWLRYFDVVGAHSFSVFSFVPPPFVSE